MSLYTQIRKIVKQIELDISDRKGLRQEWANIDEDVKEEIRDEWFNIIRDTLKNGK